MTRSSGYLISQWDRWTTLAGLPRPRVVEGTDSDAEVEFVSGEGSYVLRRHVDRWTVDESDDRGHRYPAQIRCSTFDLAAKYLIWTWATTARSVVGAPQLGRRYQMLGPNASAGIGEGDRPNTVKLTTSDGWALVPASKSVILSHVLALSFEDLDKVLSEGL